MREHIKHHAATRSQQPALPPFVLDLLLDYGTAARCGGADQVFFDKAAIRRLRSHFGGERGLRLVEHFLNAYAVVPDDGSIVTATRRTRRVHRP